MSLDAGLRLRMLRAPLLSQLGAMVTVPLSNVRALASFLGFDARGIAPLLRGHGLLAAIAGKATPHAVGCGISSALRERDDMIPGDLGVRSAVGAWAEREVVPVQTLRAPEPPHVLISSSGEALLRRRRMPSDVLALIRAFLFGAAPVISALLSKALFTSSGIPRTFLRCQLLAMFAVPALPLLSGLCRITGLLSSCQHFLSMGGVPRLPELGTTGFVPRHAMSIPGREA